jgi:hypothetical protein
MKSAGGILTFIAIAFGALTGLWLARHLPSLLSAPRQRCMNLP